MTEKELFDKLQSLKDEYNKKLPNMKVSELADWRKKIKDANKAYIDFLIDGCEPGPNGEMPHAIKQPDYYEIGSLISRHPGDPGQPLRVRGFTRQQAVDAWNNGDYWLK